MSDVVTVNGKSEYTDNDQIVSIVSGSATISGGTDTVQSSVSGVGITLLGNQETAQLQDRATLWCRCLPKFGCLGRLSSPHRELQYH